MSESSFGFISTNSTSKNVNFVAFDKETPDAVVGRLVFFDINVNGEQYRSIGTVTSMMTENSLFSSGFEMASSRGLGAEVQSKDVRKSSIDIQAVFRKDDEGVWQQHGSALPTSPSTRAKVELLTDDTVNEMLQGASYPTVGYFRGLKTATVPLNIPNYSDKTGAKHVGILGRSGSGKDLALDTPIPTPSGWTTMGELKDGDYVLSDQGEPIKVVKAHEILTNSLCYEVTFSDGSKIVAGSGHLWYTETEASRKSSSYSRNVSSRVNAKRETLLSEDMISNIRFIASECDAQETITVSQAEKIISDSFSSAWVSDLAKTLTPAGFTEEVPVKGYSTESFTANKKVKSFNKVDMLSYFVENRNTISRLKKSPKIVKTLESLIEVSNPEEKITITELRELLGVPKRSGSFGELINKTSIQSETITINVPVKGATYVPNVAKIKTALYPKAELLNLIAEYGSRVVNDQCGKQIVGSVKTTQEIADTLTYVSKGRQTWNHSVPVAKALELPEATLPIHPYVLGAWLGDGNSASGILTSCDLEIKETFESLGYNVTNERINSVNNEGLTTYNWSFSRLSKELKEEGLCLKSGQSVKNNGSPKHIPASYLRASITQRKELLAGLMDTDGNATKSASVEYTSIVRSLAENVQELALSLGYRATLVEKRAKLYGVDKGPKFIVRWSTTDDVFKLSRKIATHRANSVNFNEHKNNQRYIVSVKEIPTVETRCITVDSENALYLAGRNFIPTHNTAFSAMLLSTYMSHENHAIFVIDPQGQWSNENGIPFSPQKFAKGLGREVTVLRMSEDISLPMDADIFGRMMDKLNLWSRFRRMGSENRGSFSREVAERIAKVAYNNYQEYNADPRDLLAKIFKDIAYSSSAISRIYASNDKQEQFRNELLQLAGEPVYNSDGEEAILTDEDYEDIESNWESILFAFKPLHSLFSSKNISGNKRKPLGGDKGFLTDVFQVRGNNPSKPAPYVVVDMSPNVKLHAKAGLAKNDSSLGMQKMLDNGDVKALMLMIILAEIKKASEIAFATSGGGNLNTQIVFDEAWRFAPEGKNTPEIEELATMLEGFALDTRKFGIGWTYILQSPGDLKTGIWRQLSYVVSGYGLVGEDIRRLEGLTDDTSQVDLYRQFISPAATGDYPFMIMGPISPLIFSTSPTFVNAFTSVEDFLEGNCKWVTAITKRRSLPNITSEYMLARLEKPSSEATGDPVEAEDKEFIVGKTKTGSQPQTAVKKPSQSDVISKPESTLPNLPF